MLGRRCHYPLASQAPRQVPAAPRLEVRSPCHWVSAVYVKVPPFVSRCCEISTTWSMKISEVVDVTLRMSCSTSRELTSLEAQVNLFQWPRDHFFHVASMASEQFFTAVSLNGCVSRLLAATQTYLWDYGRVQHKILFS